MANVKLSQRELDLVTNTDFILTKNNIIAKVFDLFGDLSEFEIKTANNFLDDEIKIIAPKISKGENYEGLPWVMLDYPRYFTTKDIFAIRTYFWWGNYFSVTLHLKGKFKERFQAASFMSQEKRDWFLCCNENEWQHHFRKDNYKLLNEFSEEEIQQLSFIKLAKKIPLHRWDDAEMFLKESFETMLGLLQK
ncbi:hypothetical protein GALL_94530 [mine drainage metagenome]|uniref:Uncharacterized protein n=1 Tax=mine drainage metagenome TaxID=410659 RepID=A0A1J5SW82_9ZZZZ